MPRASWRGIQAELIGLLASVLRRSRHWGFSASPTSHLPD